MRSIFAVLAAGAAVVTVGAGAAAALAAPVPSAAPRALAPADAAAPAATAAAALAPNPGAVSPSLSVSVSSAGNPEIAVVGKDASLWYYTKVKGRWRHLRLSGPGSADSGPSLVSGAGTDAQIAVEGPAHRLYLYVKASGHWTRATVAGKGSTYSAPSMVVRGGTAIAVEGKNHSLWCHWGSAGKFRGHEILNGGWEYSAPSLALLAGGQLAIAIEGPGHALAYLTSQNSPTHWLNTIVRSSGTAYSAPSLVVFSGAFETGVPFIFVEGPQHSLDALDYSGGWNARELEGPGWCYSAPAAQQNSADPSRPAEIAFQGSSHSVTVLFFNNGVSVPGWQNDVITAATGAVNSAPAVFDRFSHAAGEADVIFQGKHNTLWFYDAAKPATTGLAPSFTGKQIGRKGSAFGG